MKTKIKLMALVAGLLSVLPMSSAWAGSGGSFTGWAKLTASASGAGKVYVSDAAIGNSTSGLTNSKTLSYENKTTSGSAPTSADVTFYVKAVPDSDDYGFTGWAAGSGVTIKSKTSAETTVTITSTSDNNNSPTEGTVTATFKPYHEYRARVRCQIIGGGKVAIGDSAYSDSEIVSPEQKCAKTLNDNASFSFAVHAQETGGWSFVRWKDAGGKQLSTTADYTHKVTSAKYGDDIEEVTLIAEFAQSHTYYAKTDVYVDETCPNGGVVAISRTNSSSGLTYGSEATLTDNQTLADNSASFKYYAFAKCADDWWNFGGWYEDGQLVSREPNFSFDTSTSSEDEANPAGRSLAAKFVQAPLVSATCKQSEGGSYKVNGTCNTAPTVEKLISAGTASESVGLPRSLSITLSAATPADGYKFRHWWKIADDGSKVALSESASVSIDVPEDGLMVGADFIPAGLNYVANDTCFETIADAVAAGETSVSLIGNYEVVENVTVPAGAELIVPEGATLTVDAGVTLTVDGTLWVSGTVVNNGDIGGAGAVSVMNKQFKQTGKDGMNGAAAEPFFPFTAPDDGKTYRPSPFGLKYWDTKSTTAQGSVSGNAVDCTSQTHMTLLNGKGQEVHYAYSGTLPAFIKCNLDTSVAINHITSFTSTTYSGLQDAYSGGGFCLYTGSSDATASFGSSTSIAKTFTVDGVHKSMTISCKQQNGAVVLTFVNCNTASISKINNSTVRFVNCTSAKSGNINNNETTYSPYAYAYDCGNLSFSFEGRATLAPAGMAPAGVYVFSGGTYTFSYSYMNCHLFGGTFSKQPQPDVNCTIGPGLKVSGTGPYVVEPSEGEVSIKLTVDGKTVKKSSLEDAIKDAGTSQATIALSDDLELAAPVTIGAEQNIILQLAQHKIVAKKGAIVNNGNLTVDCWSSEQGSMTTESGTLIKNCAGELHLAYGTYSGEISVEGGVLYTHAGVFDTSLTVAGAISDPTTAVKIRGGQFKNLTYSHGGVSKELVGLCPEGYHAMDAGAGRSYLLPDVPVTITENTSSKVGSYSCETVYDFEFLTYSERAIYKKGNARTEQSSLQNWFRKAELFATVDPQTTGFGPDGVVSFDRDVAAGAVKAYGEITTPLGIRAAKGGELPRGLAARGEKEPLPDNTMTDVNNLYLPDPRYYYVIYENGALQSFSVFMNDLSGDGTVGLGRADPGDLSIIGTTCRIDLMLCRRSSRNTQKEQLKEYKILTSRFHKFSGKGAIFGSTDYTSLEAALKAANFSGTVKLSRDCEEAIVIDREASFTLDLNNFKFVGQGSIAAASGFTLTEKDGVYSVEKDAAVPPVAKIDGVAYTDIYEAMEAAQDQKATLVLLDDVAADVKLTPDWSLNLNGHQVIGALEVAEDYKADYWLKRSGDICSAAPYVAQVGNAKYSSLANALNAAKYATKGDDGAVTVLLLRDTTESVVLPEGVKLDKRKHEVGAVKTAGGYFKVVTAGEVLSVDIDYVAVVNGVVYQSFDAAVAAVAEGGTVKVVKNCTSEQLIAKTVTIELGSFEVAGLAANEEKGFVLSELVNGVRTVTQPVVAVALEQSFESLADAIAAIAELPDVASTEVEIELKKNCAEQVAVDKPCKFALTGDFAFAGEIAATGDLSVCRNGDVWSVVAAQKVATQDEKSIVKVNSDVFAAVKETLESGVTGEVSDDDVKDALSDAIADALKSPGAVIDNGLAKVGTDQETNLKTIDVELDKNVTKGELATGLYQATKIVEIEVADGVKKSVTVLDEADDVKPDAVIKTESKRASLILAVPGDKVKVGTELVPVTVDNVIAAGAMTDDAIVVFRVVNGVSVTYSWRFDGTDWKANDNGPEATEIELTAGSAFRYERPSYNPAPIAVTVVAQYEAEANLSTTVQEEGWNIVANPNVDKPFNLNEIVPDQNAATEDALAQDEIIVPEDIGQRVYTYVAGQWGYDATTVEEKKVGGRTIRIARKERKTDALIEAGKGFWYNSKAAKPTIPWRKVGAK